MRPPEFPSAQQIAEVQALVQAGIQLLDHQADRAIRAAALAVRLLIGGGDDLAQQLDVDRARGRGGFRKLSGKELVHANYPATSKIVVTVMVWLWSSHTPDALCGEISPYE